MNDLSPVMKRWLARLESDDPAEREASIKALKEIGDVVALSPLAEIFATDSEPGIRSLAQDAGKAIYYGALRRAHDVRTASNEERRQAAEILAKARKKKQNG